MPSISVSNDTRIPTYPAMHQRLRKQRGPARAYLCTRCRRPARDWAYSYSCPYEWLSRIGPYCPCPDLAHYVPLCKPCHAWLDGNGRIAWARWASFLAELAELKAAA